MNREELHSKLVNILHETFDIAPEKITLDADLREDLDIDSIDAVDLMVQLKQVTGKRIQPEAFRSVRTVGDVLDAVCTIMQAD